MIVDVGAADDFVPETPRVCDINGREVVIVSSNGEWFGVRNICPHQTETLALGRVIPEIKMGDEVGRYRATNRMLIACPRHVWAFDLTTGHCVVDPTLRVRAYTVYERDGRVLVDDGRPDQPVSEDSQTRQTASQAH